MLLGIDLGTSSIKVSLLDPTTQKCVASATAPENDELPRQAPQLGWTEQNPEDWWQATIAAIKMLPAEKVSQVTAIGIGYQMHGLVLIDSEHNVLRPAIIWSDGRAVASGAKIQAEIGPDAVDSLLNEPGNFTLAKLRWVRDNEPEIFAKTHLALLPGDYLVLKLTGEATTTSTGISEMMGWDHVSRKPSIAAWSAAAGTPILCPFIVPIIGYQASVSSSGSMATGLPKTAKVTYRAGDQPNNAFSLGVLAPGDLAAVAGTSGVLYGVTPKAVRDPQSRVNSFVHVNDTDQNPLGGVLMCINGAGSSYSWLRKVTNTTFDNLNEAAARSPAGADGILSFPFGNGAERIFNNQIISGSYQKLDYTQHGLPHLARATLESVAFTMFKGFKIMQEMGVTAKSVRVGNASMFRSTLFCQIFADLFQADLLLFDTDGSLGAARAAGVGSGAFANPSEALSGLRQIESYQPNLNHKENYNDLFQNWNIHLSHQLENSHK
jgi:xylulokinase